MAAHVGFVTGVVGDMLDALLHQPFAGGRRALLEALPDSLLQLNARWASNRSPRYEEAPVRLAYSYRHMACSAWAVRTMLEDRDVDGAFRALMERRGGEPLRLHSVGSGPGTEALAVAFHLLANNHEPERPWLDVLFEDRENVWAEELRTMAVCLRDWLGRYGVPEDALTFRKAARDLLEEPAGVAAEDRDVCVMNLVLSELEHLDLVPEHLRDVRERLSEGGLLLMMDLLRDRTPLGGDLFTQVAPWLEALGFQVRVKSGVLREYGIPPAGAQFDGFGAVGRFLREAGEGEGSVNKLLPRRRFQQRSWYPGRRGGYETRFLMAVKR